jgi:hypothetical protein
MEQEEHCRQNWSAYNAAQSKEKSRFVALLLTSATPIPNRRDALILAGHVCTSLLLSKMARLSSPLIPKPPRSPLPTSDGAGLCPLGTDERFIALRALA